MRDTRLDKLRGLAIVLMILDHVLAVTDNQSIIRYTLTRASMPLFFVVAGHLIKRIDYPRLVFIGLIGLVLPEYVRFIDAPNVLLIYALSVPLLILPRKYIVWIAVFCLTIYANNWGAITKYNAYAPLGLLGLMLVGKMMTRDMFEWGKYLPKQLILLGRYPLTIYVGHTIIIETVTRFTR